jgi:hypothetical protein
MKLYGRFGRQENIGIKGRFGGRTAMKTIFRFLNMGMLLAAVTVVGASYSFAQDVCSETDAQTKLQDTIRGAYQKDKKTAIETGKQLLEKYGTCEFSADFVAWLKPQIPKWEDILNKEAEAGAMRALFQRFDKGIESDNYDEMAAAGKEILAKQPDNLNILIPLGIAGARQTNKQPDESIRYAQTAISTLQAKECSKMVNGKKVNECGALKYQMTKENAVSELNYALGYLNYWVKKDKKAAVPFYYTALTNTGSRKDDPYGYATLGEFYQEDVNRRVTEYAAMVKDPNQAPQPNDPPEVAAEKDKKLKAAEGMLKGYLDRAIDAYGRAWKATPATDKNKAELYKTLQALYKIRFQKAEGLDAYVSSTVAKPLPNPTSEVTPVVEAEPTPTNTTTGAPAATVTKPVSQTTTAKVSDSTMSAAQPKAEVPAKKPAAPKKKGTK